MIHKDKDCPRYTSGDEIANNTILFDIEDNYFVLRRIRNLNAIRSMIGQPFVFMCSRCLDV